MDEEHGRPIRRIEPRKTDEEIAELKRRRENQPVDDKEPKVEATEYHDPMVKILDKTSKSTVLMGAALLAPALLLFRTRK